jgi:capsular polysaccharide biosynthesis protein
MDPRFDLVMPALEPDDRPLETGPRGTADRGISIWATARRWRALLVAATVAAGVAGFAVGASKPPTYAAKTVLLVGPTNTDYDTVRAAGQLAQTYAQLATTEPLLRRTARRLHLDSVSGEVSASANAVTRLLTITVKDHDRGRAVNIAGTHASQMVALGAQRRSGVPTDSGRIQVVEPAQASSSPVGLGAAPIGLAAALVGLLGALGVAVILDRSSGAVRDASDVMAATGTGVIARLSGRTLRAGPDTPLVVTAPKSRSAHEIRRLATRLRAVGAGSILVMELDERATGVAANLAAALTAGGREVTVIDAGKDEDARIPADLAERVTVRAAGADTRIDEAPPDLLLQALVESDILVIRAPGLDRSPVGLHWARVADGTLLVASTDRTSRGDLVEIVESVRLVRGRLLGTVLASGSPYALRR